MKTQTDGIDRDILGFLKANRGNYVSGQEICENLGISRNAVWKHMKALKAAGYPIDAKSRKGYVLTQANSPFNAMEIESVLKTKFIGKDLHFMETTESTNSVAMELAKGGAAEGAAVISDSQKSGKGRMGRRWHSPPGVNIYTSVILRPRIAPHSAPVLSLAAAVAVVEAIEAVSGIKASVKWPNDVQINSKKVSGILFEMASDPDTVKHMAVGIGINVNMDAEKTPEDIRGLSTSLKKESGKEISRVEAVAALYFSLEKWYKIFLDKGNPQVLDAWRNCFNGKGKDIKVNGLSGAVEGVCEGIDSSGALLVRTKAGVTERIMAGDVSL
ncbi:MAG: biotin--[acetyl-CoA-carboxylase] ligase [Deltaproteobacteria bacterium]|nr:biotin--[acetyl-CoA-carboxylase] ligase [Deltaproteobacteria bacterium]